MNIQPISMSYRAYPVFTAKTKRKDAPDRSATVQDLYAMEDRINEHNKELLIKQNKMIGKALLNFIKMQYSNDYYYYQAAQTAASELMGFDGE